VLTNRRYRDFAARNTVEVICMQDTDEALRNNDPQIRTYEAKDAYGLDVEYVAKFPGLTIDQVRDLGNSDALRYMEGKLMPATVIVDPHTLDKMGGIPRAERRAKGFITAIEPHVVALRKKYGKGIDRDVWNRVHAAGPRIDVLLIEGEVGEAWKLFREVETAAAPHEEKLGPRIRTLRASLAKDATQRLDRVEQALAEGGRAKRNAKRELRNLAKALKGTDFERRAASLLDAAK